MRQRLFLFLLSIVAVGGAGGAGAACSSSSGGGGGGGGDDSVDSGGVLDATAIDAGAHDTGSVVQDSSTGPLGDCSAVAGECDIVAQNCPGGQECVLTGGAGGTTVTACEPTTASESIPKGYGCCPGNTNPCLPGLECNGQTECTDGGPSTGVCSARCCEGTIRSAG